MGAISTRIATPADASAAIDVVRRSITELCAADHQHDAPTLEHWLRNKTPEHFDRWCADLDNRLAVAELDGAVAGVAALHRSGEVRLCYVSPECTGSGVDRALLVALEAHARDWGIDSLHLNSTRTARRFYERCGFVSSGDASPGFGLVLGYPYVKRI